MRLLTSLVAFLLLACSAPGQIPPEVGQGWLPEFTHSGNQLLALAEAIPAEKYSWRPAPDVRSVSEVFMHLALGNYFMLIQAGVKPKPAAGPLNRETEKKVTAKAEVIDWLKHSFAEVKDAYPQTDRTRKMKFLNQESTVDNVFIRLLVHNHEHMGQMIAYARMIGVVPPWSRDPGGD